MGQEVVAITPKGYPVHINPFVRQVGQSLVGETGDGSLNAMVGEQRRWTEPTVGSSGRSVGTALVRAGLPSSTVAGLWIVKGRSSVCRIICVNGQAVRKWMED